MGAPDRRCGVYFDKLTAWEQEARALRAILLDSPLDEAFKWRSPVYTYGNSNVCNVAVTKSYCAIGFFKGVLMEDPQGLLVAPGENSRAVRMAKFADVAQIENSKEALAGLILDAVRLEKEGAKVDLPKDDIVYPDELVRMMDDDPVLREAFEALTPGRQRGWVLHFAQPKQEKTRFARIEKALPLILEGRGMHDR